MVQHRRVNSLSQESAVCPLTSEGANHSFEDILAREDRQYERRVKEPIHVELEWPIFDQRRWPTSLLQPHQATLKHKVQKHITKHRNNRACMGRVTLCPGSQSKDTWDPRTILHLKTIQYVFAFGLWPTIKFLWKGRTVYFHTLAQSFYFIHVLRKTKNMYIYLNNVLWRKRRKSPQNQVILCAHHHEFDD